MPEGAFTRPDPDDIDEPEEGLVNRVPLGEYADGSMAAFNVGIDPPNEGGWFYYFTNVGRSFGKTYRMRHVLDEAQKLGADLDKQQIMEQVVRLGRKPIAPLSPSMSFADVKTIAQDSAAEAFLKARRSMVPTTVRTKYYRGSDTYRVVVCAGDKELTMVGTFVEGGAMGRIHAEWAADDAAFVRLLPTSWIDLP